MDTLIWKDTNPKDAVGIRKWRVFSVIPFTVLWELGLALLEGGRKYGRHNYRVSGIRASVYVDAAFGHISQWWEGEDLDPDTGLSHITKAIASLTVMRDAMIQEQFVDDRPPKTHDFNAYRDSLQDICDDIFDRIPDARWAVTELNKNKWSGANSDKPQPAVEENRDTPQHHSVGGGAQARTVRETPTHPLSNIPVAEVSNSQADNGLGPMWDMHDAGRDT